MIPIAYPDRETTENVRRTLAQLTVEHVIALADAVVVTREENGKVKLHQVVRPAAAARPTARCGAV